MVFQIAIDTCANTPKEKRADTDGCSDSQKDTDNDLVSRCYLITCADTPNRETLDVNGCFQTVRKMPIMMVFSDADDTCC